MISKRIILIVLGLTISLSLNAQTRRALVIGIGEYPKESGWSAINGDNDIDIVCAFLSENGFSGNNIVVLKNSQATKANIVKQFKAIAAAARPGDCVYIHFSGHGQQVTDMDGDEDDGWDEAWIPYDADKRYVKGVYEGGNHLVDDQINALLRSVMAKIGRKGDLVVVADACHSGDSSRGEDEESEYVIRGTEDRFEIAGAVDRARHDAMPIEWIMISACKPYQNNYECVVDGKHYGSLSYSLYSQRTNVGNTPLDVISKRVQKSVSDFVPMPQTIMVETPGELSGHVLFRK